MINKTTIAVLVILLAAGAFIVPRFYSSGDSEITFRTAEVDRGDVVSLIASNGTVNPLQSIDVSSRVAGTVSAVNVDFNDPVSAGDPLAEIDPSLLETELRKAEADTKKAEAELAYTLQQNITNQEVKAEEVQVEVVERQKRIQVQEQEALRKEKELEATVKKPAEAEQYRIQTLANAKKFQTLTEAEGQAAASRSIGEGDADANKARGLADAEIIRRQGLAEAEAMEKKALSWQMYNQAAIIQQIVEALPQVAAAVAQPLSQTDRIVVINSGGDGGAGASKVTQDVTNIVAQVPTTIEALTGIDLMETLKNLPAVTGTPAGDEDEK